MRCWTHYHKLSLAGVQDQLKVSCLSHQGTALRSNGGKGILHIKGAPKRVIFQGVQMMFDCAPDRFWNTDEKRETTFVFIGKELDEQQIREGFATCLADE